MTTTPPTTRTLLDLLRRHYMRRHYIRRQDFPGGIFLAECGLNGVTGRRCDAVHVGFTATSGRILRGHEIKVTRSDWLTELSKVDKASTWADACHEWWLVVSDPAIVHDGELPPGWGLMTPTSRGIKVRVRAERKPADHQPPWLVVRSIMARLDTLQAQERERTRADLRTEINAQYEEIYRNRQGPAPLDPETRERLQVLNLVEDSLGVQITQDWWTGKGTDPRQFARALQLTELLGRQWRPQEARRVAADAARVARELETIAAFVDDGSVS